ncbi:MAG: threonine/serine exporter family protein [Lagierella massiliensis]|nr:threonine/serine exporter family protein [Lagierella massiliensis]
MNILINTIMSGFAAVGFSLVYKVPRKSLFGIYCCGGVGMLTYLLMWEKGKFTFGAYLLSSLVIGITAEIFARINKLPATVFLAPGLIPLVPGLAIYNMMNAFASKNITDAVYNIVNAGNYALALALGIVLSSIFSRSMNNYRTYFKNVRNKRMEKNKNNKINKEIK